MAKAQRFLFSFSKFIKYLKNNQDTLNLNSRTDGDSFSDEITFYLDDKLSVSEEDIRGQAQQYFLVDNDMVIAYGSDRSSRVYIYYVVNPENDKDIYLIRDMETPFVDETLHPIKLDVFNLLKEYGGIDKGNN